MALEDYLDTLLGFQSVARRSMPHLNASAYSYRNDPAVPPFDDSKALFVFDGVCVLCSSGASWLMRHDRGKVNFASAQAPLGEALFRHYAISMDDTYLLIDDGSAYTKSAGYLELCSTLGGWWHIFRGGVIVPERWRDAFYALIARNRYRWFGKTDYCRLLSDDQRQRLL